MNQTTRRLTVIVASCLLLAACSTPEPFVPGTLPTESKDKNLSELLPIGPHTVTLESTTGSGETFATMAISGYINLPASYDLAKECSFELTGTETRAGATTTFTQRKTAGGPAWRRVDSSNSEYITKDSIGQWHDGDDLEGYAPLILLPALLLEEFGGGLYWCNLRRIDQIATLVDASTGRLDWNHYWFNEVVRANADAYVLRVLESSGLSGRDLDLAAASVRDVAQPTYSTLLDNTEAWVTGDTEKRVLTLYYRKDGQLVPAATIVFTPTEPRDIEGVVGTKTYIEKVADGEVEPFGETGSATR
jgi:hypothetical protein